MPTKTETAFPLGERKAITGLQNPRETFPNFASWRLTDEAVLLKANQSRHFCPKENKLLLNDVTERQSQEILSKKSKRDRGNWLLLYAKHL